MFPAEVLNNFARGTFRRIKIDMIILSGRWKSWRGIARKGVTPRDERCGIVGRLLTSMHLLTCSNGLRYFYIKLTAVGQVTAALVFLQCIEEAKISDGAFVVIWCSSRISKHLIRFIIFSPESISDHEIVFFSSR